MCIDVVCSASSKSGTVVLNEHDTGRNVSPRSSDDLHDSDKVS